MKRILNPATNANGWLTLLAAAWAIASAVHHFSPQTQVYAGTVGAALALVARSVSTPVGDPRIPGKVVLAPPLAAIVKPGEPSPEAEAQMAWAVSYIREHYGKDAAQSPSGSLPPAVQPPATTTGSTT